MIGLGENPQRAADRVESRTSLLVLPATRSIKDADRLLGLPRITEFRRVVQHENRAVRRRQALTSGLKMPGQNRHLVNAPVGKEPIRCLGVTPILASQRDGLAESACQLPNQLPESPSKSRVTEPAAGQFLIESLRRPARGRSTGALHRPLETIQPIFVLAPGRFILHRKAPGSTGRSCG